MEKQIKKLLALFLMLLCCNVVVLASNEENYDKATSYSACGTPSDGTHIKTIVSQNYMDAYGNVQSVNVQRSKYHISVTAHKDKWEINGSRVYDELYFYVLVSGYASGTVDRIFLTRTEESKDDNKRVKYNRDVDAGTINVTYNMLEDAYYKHNNVHLNELGSEVYIYFDYVVHTHIDKQVYSDCDEFVKTDESSPVTLYFCNAGKISANSNYTPIYTKVDDNVTYALYPTANTSSNYALQITSIDNDENVGEVSTFQSTNQQLVWTATNTTLNDVVKSYYFQPTVSSKSVIGTKTQTFTYSDLNSSGTLIPGTEYSIVRKNLIKNTEVECTTEPVNFYVVEEAKLEGFSDNTKIFVCESKDEFDKDDVEFGNEVDENVFLKIEGNPLNIEKLSYVSVYGVTYKWQYKNSKSSTWQDIPTKSDGNVCQYNSLNGYATYYASKPQDLIVPKAMFEAGNTYEFRQVATLTNFQNREILAAENGVVKVTTYKNISASDFKVADMGTTCGDGQTKEVTLGVTFTPSAGTYLYADKTSDSQLLDYSWKFADNSGSEQTVNLSKQYNVVSDKSQTLTSSITVTDGCQTSVKLSGSIVFEEQPVLDPNYIICSKANLTYDNTTNVVTAEVPDGVTAVLNVSSEDKNYSTSGYWYSEDKGETYKEINSRGLEVKLGAESEKTIYLKKKNKNGSLCESEPVVVVFGKIGSILNNTIVNSSMLVCKGERNPLISAQSISGGYAGGNVTYKWIYSTDNVSYSPMVDDDDEIISTSSVEASAWKQPVTVTYYIKRIATSSLGNGSLSDTSAYMKLMPYATPTVTLTADNKFVCYGEEVALNMTPDIVTLAEMSVSENQGNALTCAYGYGSRVNSVYAAFDKTSANNFEYHLKITQDTVVYATFEMCGTTYTSAGVKITSGDNLEPTMEYGDCKVRGGKMDVTVGNPATGRTYSIEQNGVEIGETEGQLSIPSVGAVEYQVSVSDANCSKTFKPDFDENKLHEAFRHFDLAINQTQQEITQVCAGTSYTIANIDNESNNNATNYAWSVNGKAVANNDKASLNYDFPNVGTAFTIVRVSKEIQNGTLCQSISDTVFAHTYGKISGAELALSNTGYVCKGDSLQWQLSGVTGGSMNTTQPYNYYIYDGTSRIASGTIRIDEEVKEDIGFGTTGAHNLYAVVTDGECADSAYYSQKTTSQSAIQAPSSAFTLTANPNMIAESGKSTSITISAKAENGTVLADEFVYSYSNSAGKVIEGASVGAPFTVVVDSTCFTNDLMTINVTRTDGTTGCKSNNTVYVTRSSGFEDTPAIASDAISNIVCGGEKVTFSIPTLPLFGETTLKSTDVTYSWYKNGSLVGTKETYEATAVAGDTLNIICKISYKYDEYMKAAYVYSDAYQLIGKGGVTLGTVTHDGAKSLNICKASSEKITLTCDVEMASGDKIVWEESSNGNTWSEVPSKNVEGGEEPNQPSLTFNSGAYSDSTLKVVYFRVKGTSECGTSTYSKNIFTLNIDTIPAVPVVALRSSNVISGSVSSLNFSPKSDFAGYAYNWGTDIEDLNAAESNGGSQVALSGDYEVGENTIYVKKYATTGGKCASAVAEYTFKLYEELSIGNLFGDDTSSIRCPKETTANLYVNKIKGGSGEYAISWEYKREGDSWIAFDKTTDLPFAVEFEEGKFVNYYQYGLVVSDLTATTSFRATISSTGDYKGASKTTNEYTITYYDKLKDGGIDNEESLVCYGSRLPNISGKQPTGGDNDYSFQWYKTTTPEDDNSWTAITSQTRLNYTGKDTMYQTTYFKRVVTDGCGSKVESRSKRVEVQEAVKITAEDVSYNKAVSDGKSANMWGVRRSATDESVFVWYDSKWSTLDTTEVGAIYTTKSLNADEDQKTYTYYAKKIDAASGCLSYNNDTLLITAYSNTSGVIFVNGTTPENENNYWVCPSTSDVTILSEKNPNGATYKWYYRVTTNASATEPTVGDWTALRCTSGALVTSENVHLDTLGLTTVFKNTTGKAKFVEFKRLAIFTISGENAEMESNVVKVNIVPTMESVNIMYDLAGTLTSEKTKYCKGEEAEVVNGEVDLASETMTVWNKSNKYFGGWLYDSEYQPEGFNTWFEYKVGEADYDTAKVYQYNKDGYAKTFMPGEGINHAMNATYNVRRAINDGCTSAYTNVLPIYVTDAVGTIDNIQMYGYESGSRTRMYKGFEIGDSLIIGYQSSDGADCMWALDSTFENPLEESKSYVSFIISEDNAIKLMEDAHIYMKRLSNGCWSSTLAIPIALGTKSNGGTIGGNQKVCYGADFEMIGSVVPAQGDWIAPEYTSMKWKYGWQYSKDSTNWVTIAGADSVILTADLVNKYAGLMSGNDCYFRRVATNDSARVRYSNGVKLSYYDELKAGELTLSNDAEGYCVGEDLPNISSTEAVGGRVSDNGVTYTWYVSLNGGEFAKLADFKTEQFQTSFADTITKADRSKNVAVSVKCAYTDGEGGCGEVESKPVSFVLYRMNEAPSIYQDNDSCDAQEVIVKVLQESDKTYNFVAFRTDTIADQDSVIWTMEATQQTIKRMNGLMVENYGVYSVDNLTACVSDYNYFNVDSIPELTQESLSAPEAVCYGADFTVKGSNATGGNGEKSYSWQYSYDGTEWDVLANKVGESLDVVDPKLSIYYRRIASDKCASDTTAAVFIKVREKIAISKDDITLKDFKCEGRSFNVELAGEPSSKYERYVVSDGSADLWESVPGGINTFEGFEGDSMAYYLTHVVIDSTTGDRCYSEKVTFYAHNAVVIDHEQNVISCDDQTPCNGRYVEVAGGSQTGSYADKLTYKWYVSKDGKSWTEQLLKTGKELDVQVADTMYIIRTEYNGCAYDTSNLVTVIGQKVEAYDYVTALQMQVVSNMQDSSVVMSIVGGKDFKNEYFFEGDGELPSVNGNLTTFPYNAETYKDSVLQMSAISDHCVSSYVFNPIRGGVISFDGDSILCGGGTIPSIVATDVEGGNGSYTYQWQYNNQFTSDYINIDGATSKEYTPSAVSVATSYRRVTTSGEYVSYSNVVTVNIRPLPKASDIAVSLADSVLAGYGLVHTQYSVEKLPGIEMSLVDTITDVDAVVWQQSTDGVTWENVESQEAKADGIYSYYITDTLEVLYYRAVGSSACGEATSKAFKVTTIYAPTILDDELVLTDNICAGDPFVRIKIKKEYSDVYSYKYRTIDYEGSGVFAKKSSASMVAGQILTEAEYIRNAEKGEALTDTTLTGKGAIFTYPKHSFDVEITRIVNLTGASSTKMVHFTVNDLSAKFTYMVDDLESHESGEAEQTVRLNQGSRVVFTPVIEGGEGGALSYKWNLIEPLNTDYYNIYGGSVGREGLTSEKESPVCYFYNGGGYTIQLSVTDGQCSSVVRDSAMYIDKNTVRAFYQKPAIFEDDEIEENKVLYGESSIIFIRVMPTLVKDEFTIVSTNENEEKYEVYNSTGEIVKSGSFVQSITIDASNMNSGIYYVLCHNNFVKIVKK